MNMDTTNTALRRLSGRLRKPTLKVRECKAETKIEISNKKTNIKCSNKNIEIENITSENTLSNEPIPHKNEEEHEVQSGETSRGGLYTASSDTCTKERTHGERQASFHVKREHRHNNLQDELNPQVILDDGIAGRRVSLRSDCDVRPVGKSPGSRKIKTRNQRLKNPSKACREQQSIFVSVEKSKTSTEACDRVADKTARRQRLQSNKNSADLGTNPESDDQRERVGNNSENSKTENETATMKPKPKTVRKKSKKAQTRVKTVTNSRQSPTQQSVIKNEPLTTDVTSVNNTAIKAESNMSEDGTEADIGVVEDLGADNDVVEDRKENLEADRHVVDRKIERKENLEDPDQMKGEVLSDAEAITGGNNSAVKVKRNSPVKVKSTSAGVNCDIKFQCDECGKILTSAAALRKHMVIHSGVKAFICETCGLSFPLKEYLQRHRVCHSQDKKYPCGTCNKIFYRRSNLTAHMTSHTEIKLYECTICHKNFKTRSTRDVHMKGHGVRAFVCDKCGKAFTRNRDLQKHLFIHKDYKPYVCVVCNKAFPYNQSLQEHMMRHRGEKPVSCNICNKRFNNKRCLVPHMRYHDTVTEFKCEPCNMYFGTDLSLKKHIHKTHGTSYVCEICDAKFSNKRHLRSHTYAEHRDQRQLAPRIPQEARACTKKVVCQFCNRTFFNRYVLSKHLMSKHHFSLNAMKTLLQIRDKVSLLKDDKAVKWGYKGNAGTSDGGEEKNFKVYYKDDEMAVFVKMGKPLSGERSANTGPAQGGSHTIPVIPWKPASAGSMLAGKTETSCDVDNMVVDNMVVDNIVVDNTLVDNMVVDNMVVDNIIVDHTVPHHKLIGNVINGLEDSVVEVDTTNPEENVQYIYLQEGDNVNILDHQYGNSVTGSGDNVTYSSENVAYSGENVTYSGENVAYSGDNVAYSTENSGKNVTYSGENVTYSGDIPSENVAMDTTVQAVNVIENTVENLLAVSGEKVNQLGVNEIAVNQLDVNEIAVNQLGVHEVSIKQLGVNETVANQLTVNEIAVNQVENSGQGHVYVVVDSNGNRIDGYDNSHNTVVYGQEMSEIGGSTTVTEISQATVEDTVVYGQEMSESTAVTKMGQTGVEETSLGNSLNAAEKQIVLIMNKEGHVQDQLITIDGEQYEIVTTEHVGDGEDLAVLGNGIGGEHAVIENRFEDHAVLGNRIGVDEHTVIENRLEDHAVLGNCIGVDHAVIENHVGDPVVINHAVEGLEQSEMNVTENHVQTGTRTAINVGYREESGMDFTGQVTFEKFEHTIETCVPTISTIANDATAFDSGNSQRQHTIQACVPTIANDETTFDSGNSQSQNTIHNSVPTAIDSGNSQSQTNVAFEGDRTNSHTNMLDAVTMDTNIKQNICNVTEACTQNVADNFEGLNPDTCVSTGKTMQELVPKSDDADKFASFENALKFKASEFSSGAEYLEFLEKMMKSLEKTKQEYTSLVQANKT